MVSNTCSSPRKIHYGTPTFPRIRIHSVRGLVNHESSTTQVEHTVHAAQYRTCCSPLSLPSGVDPFSSIHDSLMISNRGRLGRAMFCTCKYTQTNERKAETVGHRCPPPHNHTLERRKPHPRKRPVPTVLSGIQSHAIVRAFSRKNEAYPFYSCKMYPMRIQSTTTVRGPKKTWALFARGLSKPKPVILTSVCRGNFKHDRQFYLGNSRRF